MNCCVSFSLFPRGTHWMADVTFVHFLASLSLSVKRKEPINERASERTTNERGSLCVCVCERERERERES